MLPEATANMGYSVLKTSREPYQNPKTTESISRIMTTVWKYSFFQRRVNVDVANHLPSVKLKLLVN
jgi:hypothetical protein